MEQQQFFVARGQALKLPNKDVRTVADPRSGRRVKTGETQGFLKGPAQLPESLVEFLKSTKDKNGLSKLQNLIESHVVVTEAGASAPVEYAPPLPMEVEIDENAPRAQPYRDRS